MTDHVILRHSKLKSFGEIGGSLDHTYRLIDTPNADPKRAEINEHDFSKKTEVVNALKERIDQRQTKRPDNVLCVEYLVTASPTWSGWGTEKEQEFFKRSKEHLIEKFGEKNVISTHIHRDETTPHLVAYIVPFDEEKQSLNCKKWLGNRTLLQEEQTKIAEKVADLGLERGLKNSKAEHRTIKQHYEIVNKINAINDFSPNLENLPKPDFFEFKEDYAKRAINEILPDYKKAKIEAIQQVETKKEVKALREIVKNADVYLTSIENLSTENRQNLDFLVQEESSKLLSKQEKQEAEKLAQKQAEQELQEKRVSELTGIFRTFESHHDLEFFKREKIQKDLNDRLKKSEKWLSKNGLSESELFETDVLGRSKYEKPDFFLHRFDYEEKFEKSDFDFQKSIGSRAYELGVFRVVDELKQVSSGKKLLKDLEDFDTAVTPVYEAHLKYAEKWSNDYSQTQRKNAQIEREREENKKREEDHQKLVSERIRKTREFERQNSDYSPKNKKDQGNNFTP